MSRMIQGGSTLRACEISQLLRPASPPSTKPCEISQNMCPAKAVSSFPSGQLCESSQPLSAPPLPLSLSGSSQYDLTQLIRLAPPPPPLPQGEPPFKLFRPRPPPRLPPLFSSVGTSTRFPHASCQDEMETRMKEHLKKHPDRKVRRPAEIIYDIDYDLSHEYPEPTYYRKNRRVRYYEGRLPSEANDYYPGVRPITKEPIKFRDIGIITQTPRNAAEPEFLEERFKEIGINSNPKSLLHHEWLELRQEGAKGNIPILPHLLFVSRSREPNIASPVKRKVVTAHRFRHDWIYSQKVLMHNKFLRRVYDNEHLLSNFGDKLKPTLRSKPALVESPWLPYKNEQGSWVHPQGPQPLVVEVTQPKYCNCNTKVLKDKIKGLESMLEEKNKLLKKLAKTKYRDLKHVHEVNKKSNELVKSDRPSTPEGSQTVKAKTNVIKQLDEALPDPSTSFFSFIDLAKPSTTIREGVSTSLKSMKKNNN